MSGAREHPAAIVPAAIVPAAIVPAAIVPVAIVPVAIDAADAAPRIGSGYPAPFAARVAQRVKRALGDVFGLTSFGFNPTRLPPGTCSALRHAHSREDEFVFVLEGAPTLVTDAGETALQPGMCAGYPAGTGNAHHLVNRSDTDVVYLEIGSRVPGDEIEYPDDALAGRTVDGRWQYFSKDGKPY